MGILSFIRDKLKRFDKSRGLNAGTTMSNSNETNSTVATNTTVSYVDGNVQTQAKDPFQKVEINQQYPFKGTVDFGIEQFISALQYNYEKIGGN